MTMREPTTGPLRGNCSGQPAGAGTARAHGRGAPPGAMPAEHAVLGLIALAGGESHGYELSRHFDPEHSLGLGEVLRLKQSMLYQHLKKLERQGWLSVSLQPQGSRPPRQMYRITADGRAELRCWLVEPVARTREIRLEFLVKLFFALQFDRAQASRLIAEQQAVCAGLTASLQTQIAALEDAILAPAGDHEMRFQRVVLELRLEQTRAAAAWLQRLAAWNRPPSTDAGS